MWVKKCIFINTMLVEQMLIDACDDPAKGLGWLFIWIASGVIGGMVGWKIMDWITWRR